MTDDDQHRAGQEARARERLLAAGAADLPRPPWLHPRQPPAAADLVRYALWRQAPGDDIAAALTLLPAVRSEVDQLEAALLFTARAQGLSWARISRALGLGSPQAAQQRYERVAGRVGR